MFKKYYFKIIVVLAAGILLYGTNPDYKQHELKVAKTCQSKETGVNKSMCPLGYGEKQSSSFNRNLFFVYNAGILSYSIYQQRLASFGILGNVFLSSGMDEA